MRVGKARIARFRQDPVLARPAGTRLRFLAPLDLARRHQLLHLLARRLARHVQGLRQGRRGDGSLGLDEIQDALRRLRRLAIIQTFTCVIHFAQLSWGQLTN